ncbi:sensor histidine kinase [Antarcticirhabdus aurantiaca]|uniref:PAS domain-containing protein n=1 Tax=Antarcticirhabdus aurantiaca TaxID=2606717 RepID=A0ACD4NKP8_9HYPH|nr:HWE histidine kinase domain-containing protein [Antarcticirhabdus aurantiaca]WAJ27483.1 PAS domain-containing protein [Jeongeuplla avenae]
MSGVAPLPGTGLDIDMNVETASLRRRLEEAEETLRAIREGEVDALVIGGSRPDRPDEVFTLEAGPEPYRVFMEAMDIGAAALDDGDRLLFANTALCALLGRSVEDLQESGLTAALGEEAEPQLRELLRRGREGRASAEFRAGVGDEERLLLLSAAPLRLGPTFGLALTAADFTERQRAASVEESERLARAVIASASEAVVVCDRDGRITHVSRSGLALCADVPVGRMFDEAYPLIVPEMTGLPAGEDLIAMAVGGGMIQGIEASLGEAPAQRSFLVSAAPLIVSGDDIRGCVVTLVDLTQRKEAERHQLLLMKELDHRVKNTLALVVSICTRTASSEDTVEGFRRAFLGRIHALAATHTLLAEKSWANLLIGDVVAAELAPYVPAGDSRLAMTGLDIWVSPRAATALGLVLHELATNAAKYGALSTLGGSIAVSGHLDREAEELTLEWRESGGPGIHTEPVRRGFGRSVIARSLSYAPDGGAELRFAPDGLECTIRVPWQDLQL